jgi:steroid delta-isomerase-like uncharacterized protein
MMSVEENKAVVRRWVTAWNEQDLDAAEGLLAPGYVRHDANAPDVVGPAAERQFIAGALAAFPDLRFDVEQLVAEGDLVLGRYTARGTQRGDFAGVAATHRAVVFVATESYRLEGGRIAEQWVVMDTLGLLQQLGALPAPPAPAAPAAVGGPPDAAQTASLEHEGASAPSLLPEVDTA